MSENPCEKEREAFNNAIHEWQLAPKPSISYKTVEEVTRENIKTEAEIQMDEEARRKEKEARRKVEKTLRELDDCEERHGLFRDQLTNEIT